MTLERMYTFRLDHYADKVEMYEGRKTKTVHMAIREEQALRLIEEMLSELEGRP